MIFINHQQLFGDTMNTCARIEATGQPDRIQCSKETAQQLIKSGKEKWIQKRTEPMPFQKGKGLLEAFWVNVGGERAVSAHSASSYGQEKIAPVTALCTKDLGLDERTIRLVDWNTEMLVKLLQAIAARREEMKSASKESKRLRQSTKFKLAENHISDIGKKTPLEEVREIITLPEFDGGVKQVNPDQIKIPQEVVQELHHLVSSIAKLYNKNPFHNCKCCFARLGESSWPDGAKKRRQSYSLCQCHLCPWQSIMQVMLSCQ
jgi:Adenylate and Guanylate cyclase catalytic domain